MFVGLDDNFPTKRPLYTHIWHAAMDHLDTLGQFRWSRSKVKVQGYSGKSSYEENTVGYACTLQSYEVK